MKKTCYRGPKWDPYPKLKASCYIALFVLEIITCKLRRIAVLNIRGLQEQDACNVNIVCVDDQNGPKHCLSSSSPESSSTNNGRIEFAVSPVLVVDSRLCSQAARDPCCSGDARFNGAIHEAVPAFRKVVSSEKNAVSACLG